MKVAVIQMNSVDDKRQNIARALQLVSRAIKAKAKFIALPEVFNYRGPLNEANREFVAEDIPGESTQIFMDLAKGRKVFILIGSIYERVKSSPKVYNASVLINDQGKVQAKYRKIHLFDAVIGKRAVKESKSFLAGDYPCLAKVGDYTFGLSICYDLRFPNLYQRYAQMGALVLSVPSSFTFMTGRAHWEVLLRARAIENLSYVLAPNQVGRNAEGIPSYGHSMIIGPWGNILAEASENKEEIIYAQLDFKEIKQARRILPALFKFIKKKE